ncbi:MAG: response regulator [Deltaproteobacteria bacterium]|nr:response regulator [Deltaproteobacteria bacterium]
MIASVLIIEDDEAIRELLRQLLEHEGYKVMDAPDGKAGMRVCHEKYPGLVITDIIMPEKEGIDTSTQTTSEQ